MTVSFQTIHQTTNQQRHVVPWIWCVTTADRDDSHLYVYKCVHGAMLMKQIRVLLIEDHFLARMALQSVLAGYAQIRIVGEASDGEQGIDLYRSLRPDVVVLDLRLPRVSGFDVITLLRKGPLPARIVVLSNYHGSEDTYRVYRSGAMAYLTKDASGEELINSIQNADRDLCYFPRNAVDCLAERIPELQYLGSRSLHLDESFYSNQPAPPGAATTLSVNARRPNQLFGQIRQIQNDGFATYN